MTEIMPTFELLLGVGIIFRLLFTEICDITEKIILYYNIPVSRNFPDHIVQKGYVVFAVPSFR